MNFTSILKSGPIGWVHKHLYFAACWFGHAILLTEKIQPCDMVIRTHEEYMRNRRRILSIYSVDMDGLSFVDILNISRAVPNYEIEHKIRWKCAHTVKMYDMFLDGRADFYFLWWFWFNTYVLDRRLGDYN